MAYSRVRAVMVAFPALTHFSTLCHKRHAFRKQIIKKKTCFDSISKFFLKQSHSKMNSERYLKCTQVRDILVTS